MEWQDHGTVLIARKHGEHAAILEVFTQAHGRHAGVVRGASSRKIAPTLEPGTEVAVTWRARLEDHLGSYAVEPVKSRAAAVMSGRKELAALNALTALLSFALPEREPHPKLFERSQAVLDMIGETEAWPLAYLHWELALLDEMGFGLDLSACAVTGASDGLSYVSPKTGRAVTEAGAGAWKEKLLPLPQCLHTPSAAPDDEIAQGLRTTGYFLRHWLAPALGDRELPAARQRFVDVFSR
ncbi:DNA recombination and repair protein RecO [Candidatus Rhodobacter oscarellae]|uniref:DNA repair protein RecO n=1 Tax=Candidatus Rhodobacter oscarellae TaxID=1675527 RepID=A0A0J9E8I4_9RHOB|nr:DNA repair protein RecO [Candidatus Rhodobacter lobularis]KMW59070.1 DNA recombination and repair protein RecO [Candidatus Rhodobacter lobularis]